MSCETQQESQEIPEKNDEVEGAHEQSDVTIEHVSMENENQSAELIPPKKKYKRKPKQVLDTSDENIKVVLKSRTSGPKKRIVYIYKDDIIEEPVEIVEKIKRKAGRPKKSPQMVKYVDADGNEVKNRNESKEVIIKVGGQKDIPITEKELKVLKLEERLAELESISGKKVLVTKKKQIDKRQSKVRSEKQIAAAERLVALNKQRRLDKLKSTEEVKSKTAVKAVLNELAETSKKQKVKTDEKKKIETDVYNKKFDPLYN